MDIIKFQRDLEFQRTHMRTLQQMKPIVDVSIPQSFVIQQKNSLHRTRKQQLVDTRNQSIAFENKKVINVVTNIMSNSKPVAMPSKTSSQIEIYRKHQIQKINSENKQMFARLQNISSMIRVPKFEDDFKKHKQFKQMIKRRQMKPMSLSPIKPLRESNDSNPPRSANTYKTYSSDRNDSANSKLSFDNSNDIVNNIPEEEFINSFEELIAINSDDENEVYIQDNSEVVLDDDPQ